MELSRPCGPRLTERACWPPCGSHQATTRWTVLRRSAISFLLVLATVLGQARTRPHYGGTLRVEIEGDPWQQPNGMARRLVYDGLTRMDTTGNAAPALA